MLGHIRKLDKPADATVNKIADQKCEFSLSLSISSPSRAFSKLNSSSPVPGFADMIPELSQKSTIAARFVFVFIRSLVSCESLTLPFSDASKRKTAPSSRRSISRRSRTDSSRFSSSRNSTRRCSTSRLRRRGSLRLLRLRRRVERRITSDSSTSVRLARPLPRSFVSWTNHCSSLRIFQATLLSNTSRQPTCAKASNFLSLFSSAAR